jgi:translation initiation factor eIF-2B subunit delta
MTPEKSNSRKHFEEPQRFLYMIDETIEEIQEMQTHSSSVVAVKATQSLTELLDREYATLDEFERDLERNLGALRRANTSHASLFNAMRAIRVNVVDRSTTVADAKELLSEVITRIVEDVQHGKSRAAEKAVSTFTDGECILTHDFSSTVLATIRQAVNRDISITAYVTEARPRYLGRKTARRLAKIEDVEPSLLVDGAVGEVLPRCDRVVLGMDCIVDNKLYNRIGTLPIVATANALDVPVTIIGAASKIVESEFMFENEYRSSAEVSLEPLEDIRIENPAYDSTAIHLVDQIITDNGIEKVD